MSSDGHLVALFTVTRAIGVREMNVTLGLFMNCSGVQMGGRREGEKERGVERERERGSRRGEGEGRTGEGRRGVREGRCGKESGRVQ